LHLPDTSEVVDSNLLAQVISYYHDTLKQAPEALAFLESKGLIHGELIDRFRLGYANRTLGLRLPEKNRRAGAAIRGQLERIGLYRASGHEHFNGSLIVPIFGDHGEVVQVHGRKIRDDLRPGTPTDLYLPGPAPGVWNREALAAGQGEVILAGSLIDAMTFWVGGFRNVTAAYGPDGLTEDLIVALRAARIKRVLIAFARDGDGEAAAGATAERLMAEGFACYRIEFPKGMGANTYTLKIGPAARSLGLLIRKSAWLGQGRAAAPTSTSARSRTICRQRASLSRWRPWLSPPKRHPSPSRRLTIRCSPRPSRRWCSCWATVAIAFAAGRSRSTRNP
jgi:DNA primase